MPPSRESVACEQPVHPHLHPPANDRGVCDAQRLVQPGVALVVRLDRHRERYAKLAASLFLAPEARRAEDQPGTVVGCDRAVECGEQYPVSAHAWIVREADFAFDPRAGCSACAGGVADPVLTAVGPDDDVFPLVAQVEVEEMLEPHGAPGSLLCAS